MIAWLLVSGRIVTSALTRQRTNLKIALSNFTNNNHLMKELSQFGITSFYDNYLPLKDSATYATMKHGYQKARSGTENHKLIQAVVGNFYCSVSSPNGWKQLKQTHSMAVTMNQEYISTKVPDSGRDYTRRKSKQDLQSHQFPEPKIYHYKGLAKFQCQNVTQNFRSCILRS